MRWKRPAPRRAWKRAEPPERTIAQSPDRSTGRSDEPTLRRRRADFPGRRLVQHRVPKRRRESRHRHGNEALARSGRRRRQRRMNHAEPAALKRRHHQHGLPSLRPIQRQPLSLMRVACRGFTGASFRKSRGAARTCTSHAGLALRALLAASSRRTARRFLLRRGDHKRRRRHAVLARPGELLPLGHAAATPPAHLRVGAAAGAVLAGKWCGARFHHDRRQRNADGARKNRPGQERTAGPANMTPAMMGSEQRAARRKITRDAADPRWEARPSRTTSIKSRRLQPQPTRKFDVDYAPPV
jgi:hypothetical protein